MGVPKIISVPVAMFVIWWLVVNIDYKKLEKVLLVACVVYVSYIISGFLVKPEWDAIFGSMLSPRIDLSNKEYMIMFLGIIGTTIAPWMQFYHWFYLPPHQNDGGNGEIAKIPGGRIGYFNHYSHLFPRRFSGKDQIRAFYP